MRILAIITQILCGGASGSVVAAVIEGSPPSAFTLSLLAAALFSLSLYVGQPRN
jgi:hypothetical protein